ncbi:hypothetical protein SDRG_05664 [Saprolegnia diclina VS20]|uniref:WW domain-containing protein n=1 Tax=Saprolegnia diclina (strain VS20) TaxID=1156394 RepID=T0RWE5_SAPDV|nr:hypothetical protein SDRG_05664 [Saprolegnia diclina VS20]EQC36833.1 hypothetical protein SDRG_05664 [Saprolegnia diclina VS20]|eukprot:XP_008609614.1 hypothetical protein SDRG_05664 [Saprolegnia diclina VS20]
MGPTEQEVALISHGRKILEVYKHKGVINGYIERPDAPHGDDEPAIAKHERWQSVTAKHTQSSQLLQSIERSMLKLLENVGSADTPAASLSHVTAPLVAQLRQLLRQKQLLEDDMGRDFQALGPPVVLDASNNVPSVWLAHADVDALVHAKVAPLEAELAQAKTTIDDMQVKLHAYKVQLQQQAASTSTPLASSASFSPRALIQRLERHIQEKDELIRALRETLDDVANDSSRMEKLLIAQSDSIAMLQNDHQLREATAASAVPASVLSPPTSETQDLVPPDDGHAHRVEDFETPLPPGWEMRVTNTGDVYFIHRHSKVTTWVDPRSHPIQLQPSLSPNAPLSSQYAIEFHEKRPIGVLFQPNTPVDQGACVRRVLEDTPAEYAAQIQPGHQLVAVNGHRIQEASFRHIMLLLQGGFRPLTLTFDRLVRVGTLLLDDEGQEGTRDTGDEMENPSGFSLADQLITGVFSLVWAAPDETTTSSAVQPI